MAQRQTQSLDGMWQKWLLDLATGEIITVEKPPNADGRVTSNFERDEAHKAAGHESGEVFIKTGQISRVARTPRVMDWLERGELIQVEDAEHAA
jgi:hypothetical protein